MPPGTKNPRKYVDEGGFRREAVSCGRDQLARMVRTRSNITLTRISGKQSREGLTTPPTSVVYLSTARVYGFQQFVYLVIAHFLAQIR